MVKEFTKKNGKSRLTENEKNLLGLVETITRSQLATRLGKSYEDSRDLYKALGYPTVISFEDFWGLYERGDIAKRIVDAPVNASWRLLPEIQEVIDGEGEDQETEFEKIWIRLQNKKRIFHYLSRLDKLSGIGEYGVLLLGFSDVDGTTVQLKDPVSSSVKELLYLRPYKQNNVSIKLYNQDETSERFGLPEIYSIAVLTSSGKEDSTEVHWSRVLHVAEGVNEGEVFGTPRLRIVYNRLKDLEKIAGGSAEMFWRGAFPGMAFILDKEAGDLSNTEKTAMKEELEKYFHNLQRTLKLQGMEVQNLAPQVADPSSHIDVLLSLIAGATETPKRILVGSERGELSSSQDETAWLNKIESRRTNYVTPIILRPFIDRLQEVGILPEVEYEISWPSISAPSDKEKAEVAKMLSDTLAVYANSLGASDIFPPELFFSEIMNYDRKTIDRITNTLVDIIEQTDKEIISEEII